MVYLLLMVGVVIGIDQVSPVVIQTNRQIAMAFDDLKQFGTLAVVKTIYGGHRRVVTITETNQTGQVCHTHQVGVMIAVDGGLH
jgi:hypothetical protein